MIVPTPIPNLRPWGLFTQETNYVDLGDKPRLRDGISFQPLGTPQLTPHRIEFCEDNEPSDNDAEGGEPPTFRVFDVLATESCSALDVDYDVLAERTSIRSELSHSALLAYELIHGSLSDSPSLSSTAYDVTSGGAVDIACLVLILEAAAASFFLQNVQGYIHISPEGFAAIPDGQATYRDGRWYSPSGHIYVFDAGYFGMGRDSGGAQTAYMSGPVQWWIGSDRFKEEGAKATSYLDRTRNIITARNERPAAVWFDPATTLAANYLHDCI